MYAWNAIHIQFIYHLSNEIYWVWVFPGDYIMNYKWYVEIFGIKEELYSVYSLQFEHWVNQYSSSRDGAYCITYHY